MLLTIVSLAVPWLLGYLMVSMIVPDRGRLERLSLGYGVGIGTLTLLLFLAMAFRVRLNIWTASALAVSALAVSALGSALRGRRPGAQADRADLPVRRPLRSVEHGVLAATVALLACLAFASLEIGSYWPVREWDGVAEYDYRGRVVAEQGDLAVLASDPYYVVHPLATSLGHTWMYLVGMEAARARGGGDHDDILTISQAMVPHLLYWLFYATLLGALYSCFRRDFGPALSLLFVAAVASTPMMFEQSTIAYTNLPFAYYYGLGVIYVWQWIDARRSGDLWLGGSLLALSAWTRSASEPFVLGSMVVVAMVGWKERRANALLKLIGVYLAGWLPWRLYLAIAMRGNREYYLDHVNVHGSFRDLRAVLAWLARYVGDVDRFGVVWLFLIGLGVATVATMRRANRRIVPLVLCLWSLLVWIGLFYLTPPKLLDAYARASGDRTLLSLVPLAVYALAVNPFTETARQTETDPGRPLGKSAVAPWVACAILVIGFAVTRISGGYLGTALASSGMATHVTSEPERLVHVDPSLDDVVVTCVEPATAFETSAPGTEVVLRPGREGALALRAWSTAERAVQVSLAVERASPGVVVAAIVTNQTGRARESRMVSHATTLPFGVVLQPGSNEIVFKVQRSSSGSTGDGARPEVRVLDVRLSLPIPGQSAAPDQRR